MNRQIEKKGMPRSLWGNPCRPGILGIKVRTMQLVRRPFDFVAGLLYIVTDTFGGVLTGGTQNEQARAGEDQYGSFDEFFHNLVDLTVI
jgi:hypothetical protein